MTKSHEGCAIDSNDDLPGAFPVVSTASKRTKNAKLLTVLLTAHSANQTEFQQTLEALARNLAAAPGCLEAIVARDLAGSHRFILFLAFRDSRALQAQLDSHTFQILRGAINVLSKPAEFRVVAADSAPGFAP
jgi:quinol monooxygenase YgiN